MATKREKQLAALLLKEKIEKQTGKKVILKEEEILNEAKGISSKDWQRMLDLILVGDVRGEKVANSITDKNKAIARFVCGLKLDNKPLKVGKNYRDNPEYSGSFSPFGNKALQLGATPEEIQAIYDSTEVPQEFLDKQKELSTKKLGNIGIGAVSKALLKAGYNIEFEKTNGDALTNVGRDAMRRNGRKWTIGYKTIITTPGGNKVNLNIDGITDEGGGTTYYSCEKIGWNEYGLRDFLVKLLTFLKNEDSKSNLQENISKNQYDVFELFHDTDANGPAFEKMIENIINEAKERINDACAKQMAGANLQVDGKNLRIAVKNLWISILKEWKTNE